MSNCRLLDFLLKTIEDFGNEIFESIPLNQRLQKTYEIFPELQESFFILIFGRLLGNVEPLRVSESLNREADHHLELRVEPVSVHPEQELLVRSKLTADYTLHLHVINLEQIH